VSLTIEAIKAHPLVFIKQRRELGEIIFGLELRNKYVALTQDNQLIANIVEEGSGVFTFIKRYLLRSHRPLHISISDPTNKMLWSLSRRFFFFFSDLFVTDPLGHNLGSVHRRFGILYKKYDLIDKSGKVFAKIKSPVWRLWTFRILDAITGEKELGQITKKWKGLLSEVFTDADMFCVQYGTTSWTMEQRLVIFAAAISIDFDFFENNQG
jgi:hypothetical protein